MDAPGGFKLGDHVTVRTRGEDGYLTGVVAVIDNHGVFIRPDSADVRCFLGGQLYRVGKSLWPHISKIITEEGKS